MRSRTCTSAEAGEQRAHHDDGGRAAGRGDDRCDEHRRIDLPELHAAHRQQHQDGAGVRHRIERRRGKAGDTVDRVDIEPEIEQLRCDERQRDQLAGGGTAGEHAHDGDDHGADQHRGHVDAGDGIEHGRERFRVGHDAGKAADGRDRQRHVDGVRRAGADELTQVLRLELLPEQQDGQNGATDHADVDVDLQNVEGDKERDQRNECDPEIRPRCAFVIVRIEGVELKMLALGPRLVDVDIHQDDDDDDFDRRADKAGDERHIRRRAEGGHGGDVGHLRAAGHGQRKRIGSRGEHAEDKALGNVAIFKDRERDRIHEHDEHAGIDAAHAEDDADGNNDRDRDHIFLRVAGAGPQELAHDRVGDGEGRAALRIDL